MLTQEERERYLRQIPLLGEEGQEKLQNAHVLLAGVGGLGTPIAIYLAAAGVGKLTLVDGERVERSNLNRQILHWEQDIGREKVHSAAEKLKGLNSNVEIRTLPVEIHAGSVSDMVQGVDVIIDATDNFPARYLLNRTALANGIPLVFGAVYGMYGEASTILPGETACLSCIFPEPPPREPQPVLGVTAGVIGMIQAGETLKILLGSGSSLANRLFLWDGGACSTLLVEVEPDPFCTVCTSRGDL
jgi:molybdopterin/thiamine biosynthesis adenylyltransferase